MVVFPKLAIFGLVDCHRRWLNSFQKNHIPMLVSWVSIPLHYIWLYVFTVILDWELYGLGVAGVISLGIQNLLL
jgi:Na+-driven multidrug efflux pump